MKGKKHVNAFLATTVFASVVPQTANVNAETNKEIKYTDIADSYAKNEIEYLTKEGKLYGMPGDLFEPFRPTTREEFAAILARLMNLESNPKGTTFDDVSPWAEGVVGALEGKNIISGYSEKEFGALDTLTREQMAVFFIRAMGYEEAAGSLNLPLKYEDLSDFSDWSKPIVAFATEIGLLSGFPEGKYYPKKEALRQDLAAVGYRFWSPEAGKNPYKEKAEEVIKKYTQELTLEIDPITEANMADYIIKGKTKPNQEIQVTVSYSDGQGGGVTKNVIADADGNYTVSFDLSDFPNAELTITAKETKVGDKEPEVKEKKVTKDIEGHREALEVEKMYPQGNKTVIVDFKTEPYGDEKFYFNGNLLEEKDVRYSTDLVYLTVPTMEEGKKYPVKIENNKGTKIYEGEVELADYSIAPNEIIGSPNALSLQVGEEAKIKFVATKADGTPAKNAEVRVQISTIDRTGNEQIVKEEVVYTNDKGEIEYKYTSIDIREDRITAIAVKDPLIRTNTPVEVNWSVAEKGLVEVNPTSDINQGEGTYREYNVKFKDSEGKAMPKGTTVYVYLGEDAGTTTKVKGDFSKVSSNSMFAQATIQNTDGTAKLLVTDTAGKVMKPMFYFDKDGDNRSYVYEGNDPRTQAGSVKFVKQIPSMSIKDSNPGKVDVGQKKELELTALDQFGNPYLGTIKIGIKETIDDLNETVAGNIGYEYEATGENGWLTTGVVSANTEEPTVIDFGQLYEQGVQNGIMNIKVSGGANKDVGNFIAFQDKTNNGIDATDYQVESKVEFVKKKIASVHIAGTQTVATDSYATFDLTFKDEEGKTAKLKKADGVNLVVQVLDMEGNIVGDLTSPTHKLEMETDMESRANNTADWAEGVGASSGYLSYEPQSAEYEKIAVSLVSNTPGKYKIRAFVDEKVGTNLPNNKYEKDEAVGEITVEIKAAELTSTRTQVSYNYSYNNREERFRYFLRDQSNREFNAKTNLDIEFEIKNEGNKRVTATLEDGRTVVVDAGKTEKFEAKILQGDSDYVVKVTPEGSNGATNVELKGKIKGRTDTESTGDIYWVDLKEDLGNLSTSTEDRIHEGTIVGYKEKEAGNNDRWYIISTPMGYYKVDYELKSITPTTKHKYIVDNNTDADGLHFDGTLSSGDVIKMEFNKATGEVKHTLTNK